MDRSCLEFQFDGPDAGEDAAALGAFLRTEFADWPTQFVERPATLGEQAAMRGGEIIAIIALLMNVPGALKNTYDLAERIQLKAKFERLIAWARARRQQERRVPSVVLTPVQRCVRAAQATGH